MGKLGGALPGAVEGLDPLPSDDPACAPPTCK
jgi:hypothetical protein